MRIAIITDTHVSADDAPVIANARAVSQWIARLGPDRVVHLGDIVADAAPGDYALARRIFGEGGAPIDWLPGNHDIGEDDVTAAATGDPRVNTALLAAWRDAFGADRWRIDAPGWTIIGLNAQLYGADSEASAEQTAWLARELEQVDGKLGIMLHKPLFRDCPADVSEHRRYLPLAARRALWETLSAHDLRFVASGHTHQWRRHQSAGAEHVWAPSAAYVFPDQLQETIGRKLVGAAILDLTPDGHQFAFAEIEGLRHDIAPSHV